MYTNLVTAAFADEKWRICAEKKKVGLPWQGSNIILRRCCVCGSSLSGSECAVESFPSTLTQIMCYILQANLNGRFVPNPLSMTSVLPGQTATATDTTRDTAREGAKCRHRERDRGRERGGASGCHVFSVLKKKKKKKQQRSALSCQQQNTATCWMTMTLTLHSQPLGIHWSEEPVYT